MHWVLAYKFVLVEISKTGLLNFSLDLEFQTKLQTMDK